MIRRVIVIVLDSVGVGELPDAAALRRRGQQHPRQHRRPRCRCASRTCARSASRASSRWRAAAGRRRRWRRSAAWPSVSPGKDSVTGHWELMGIVLDRAVPDVSRRVPRRRACASSSAASAARTLGNVVASGTQIIDELGAEHMRTGTPIVYTSADSVFQIAAHEDVIPVPELYRMCEIAFEHVRRGHGARPRDRAPVRRRRRARSAATAQPPRLRAAARRPTRCSIG